MAPEKRDSSEYFLEDSDYDAEDGGSEVAEGGIEEEDDDNEMTNSVDNEGGGVSRSSSVVSQQWPQSFRYMNLRRNRFWFLQCNNFPEK